METATQSDQRPGARKLLSRTERRAQLIQAAATAFARQGYSGTGLEDVALQAGVTRAIIYRHFESKQELYRAVLDDTRARLSSRLGAPDAYSPETVPALVRAACENPDGFRLLFRHAQREPDFAEFAEQRNRLAARVTETYLREAQPDEAHRRWLAGLIPTLTIELVLSWLDADRPTSQAVLVDTIRATSRALTGRR